ncbi:hypothetical protein A2U01_0087501, partial [Trifolium medium]|nr:hypothetical protein [Trifolium medium]
MSEEEQAKFMGRSNLYSGWRDNQNPRWNQNSNEGNQQAHHPQKPSPLEEAFNQFVKISQTN